ncbi:PLATZ transcription factor protein [Dioscorea alata]|uniref:PLATZ transcription factor protein n=1 Tax=Dioscorea alata TaxID=55571 RepID=A0ACB7VVR5_DIOAL|nr:PLATZ transcription factor protein [Dioscorea alata]
MVRDGGGEMPGWLGGLVEERFFVGCEVHENMKCKKFDKNIFCLHCCTSICSHCLFSHPSHPLLQVRRYVYNDVVRLDDLEKLIDCSHVQPYTINSAKVVFLKPRPQSRPSKGSGNLCLTCDRILQEPFHFCSLSCKVEHVVLGGEDLGKILHQFKKSELALSHLEEDVHVMTPTSFLDDDPLPGPSNASTSSTSQMPNNTNKKKKNASFIPQIVLSLSNRRKSAPQRSPLS